MTSILCCFPRIRRMYLYVSMELRERTCAGPYVNRCVYRYVCIWMMIIRSIKHLTYLLTIYTFYSLKQKIQRLEL